MAQEDKYKLESQTQEWKRAWNDKCLVTICAFANSVGGILLIGKDNNGNIVGVSNIGKWLKDIPDIVFNNLNIVPQVEVISLEEKDCLEVTIQHHPELIRYKGHCYKRSGATNLKLEGSALNDLMIKHSGSSWDAAVIPGVPVSSLSAEALRFFRRLCSDENNMKIAEEKSDERMLANLGLLKGGALTRAAILLFHPEPQDLFHFAYVRIGKFDARGVLVSKDEVKGPLIMMPAKVKDIIYTKYFLKTLSYEKGLYRKEVPPVPDLAFREALINAIAHRTYDASEYINIRIQEDKVTIANSGGLPEEWQISDLYDEDHESRPRNPLIAKVFNEAGQIEVWGSGIPTILRECAAAQLPRPEYKARKDHLTIKFLTTPKSVLDLQESSELTPNPEAKNYETDEQLLMALGTYLESETQKNILLLINKNHYATTSQMADELNIHRTTVLSNLRKLREKGLIKRHGVKNGFWWINGPCTKTDEEPTLG